MFPLDGKLKLAVAGLPQNGRKKWFPLARKSVSTSRNKIIFQKFDCSVPTNKQKSLNKRILFQVDRKSVYTSGKEEFV